MTGFLAAQVGDAAGKHDSQFGYALASSRILV
jgi:hypothetical protein